MKDRLDLRGFTYKVAEESFRIGARRRVDTLAESLVRSEALQARIVGAEPPLSYLSRTEFERRELEVLKTLTPSSWLGAFRLALEDGRCGKHLLPKEIIDLPASVQYVLSHPIAKYGFPCIDLRCMLRLALEAFPDNEVVKYDLTGLIIGGCYEAEDQLISHAEYLISREYEVHRSTIVLTEGSTDRRVIERSIRLLLPHLAPFFSFMDFDGVRMEGGAGTLANLVKAFAGAGISNRVIALFDNDTAGMSALLNLKGLALPATIKTLKLPAIEIAKTYPTLGPGGTLTMDINGLACGIEIYLGRDVLTGDGGNLMPIQWKGYDVKLNKYQGELLAKKKVLERFEKKLEACERDPSRVSQYDWSALNLVIDLLRTAFHREDSEAHLEFEAVN